ncbi:lasso peptide biosynthesis B2 protein [Novosphingobium sp. SG707]|uniref:lasso peptide biosynthesis B2 protein n=1 Tax=Novosphingobium sp. SG707 TaxID=2586996 RepID=UPI0014486C58|nr:lasso peptide biosynthesis B2 protein [Novosphingobium sp. SG707]NKJ00382.1 hypothetical protein [Novosphingobium sp. SG707]
MAFALKPGIHCCLRDNTPIFLDLTANRYFQLGSEAGQAFLGLVQGVSLHEEQIADLDRLEAIGLLIKVPGAAKSGAALVTHHALPTREVAGMSGMTTLALLPLVLPMLLVMRLRLRLFPKFVLQQAGKRRSHRAGARLLVSVASLVAAFDLAGLILSRADRCLERSLVMRDLLELSGHRADLVLGVATRPFGAHCWVQQGDLLIGDSIERVSFFQPIAVL